MSDSQRGQLVVALAAALLLLTGLVALPAYAHHSYPATYTGTAATGTVEFKVNAEGTAVTAFKATNVPTTCAPSFSGEITGSFPISAPPFADHEFSNATGELQFDGTFPDSQQAQGTFSIHPTFPPCDSDPVSWTATTAAPAPPQCNDSEDNDTDQAIDFPEDPGCESPSDNEERAEKIVVTTNVDESNEDGDCSLREALLAAAEDNKIVRDRCEPGSGADEIIVPADTYSLTSQLIVQDSEVTLVGAGKATTILTTNGGNFDAVWTIGPNHPIRIQDMSVRNSALCGLRNYGILTLANVTFAENTSCGVHVVGSGNLILESGLIEKSGDHGIWAEGSLTVTDSTVKDNGGIGIEAHKATIDGSTISGNATGIYSLGTLTVTDTTISGNAVGPAGYGGGISILAGGSPSTASTTLERVTVTGNKAPTGGGGGIANGTGGGGSVSDLTIVDSTIAGNEALSGGGIENFAAGGTTMIEGTTVSGNTATASEGGGISNAASSSQMQLINTTVSGNEAAGNGGGIFNSGTLQLRSSTVSANSSTGGTGGIIAGGPITLAHTILASNTGAQNDCFGPTAITSQGYNLIETVECSIGGDTTGNVIGSDPLLDPLANYGGATLTHRPAAGSPAIDAGDIDCPPASTDQRGVPRPQGAACDIGAYELEAPPQTTIVSGPSEGSQISVPTPTFAFTSTEPGSTFECRIDSGAFTPCASPTTLDPLSEGQHTFRVRAKDPDEEVDATPAGRTFTYVAPPPTPTSPTPDSPKPGRARLLSNAARTRGDTIPLKLVCGADDDCAGSIQLVAAKPATSRFAPLSASPARTVAKLTRRASFSIAAGKARVVRLKLTKKGRQLISAIRKVTARVVIVTRAAGSVRRTTQKIVVKRGRAAG